MGTLAKTTPSKIPFSLIVGIVIVLSSIEPVTHWVLATSEHDERAPTGLHIADSAIFLHSMQMFETGYYSPYATRKAEEGTHSSHYYPAPFHWMYGLVGSIGAALGIDHLVFLGIANGLGLCLYLIAGYLFLVIAVPASARLAFVVWTLGGGFGGAAYCIARVLGYDTEALSQGQFIRVFLYTLVEGPYLSPGHQGARLYYTLSLALSFFSLRALLQAVTMGCRKHVVYAAILLFFGTAVNFRFGCLACVVAWLYLYTDRKADVRFSAFAALAMAAAAGLASAASMVWLSRSAVFSENTAVLVQESLWPSPFIAAAGVQLIVLAPVVFSALRGMRRYEGILGWALAGYGAVYSFAFVAHQFYFGNGFAVGEQAAAIAISDWSLVGAALGGVYGILRRIPDPSDDEWTWPTLWLLVFMVGSVSALGHGWLLQFTPQRLMVLLAIPMAMLTAEGVLRMNLKSPKLAWAMMGILVGGGVTSLVVGGLVYQGPYGPTMKPGDHGHLRAQAVGAIDDRLLAQIGEGVVLTPGSFSDIVSIIPGRRVLGGLGSADLSDQMSIVLQPRVDGFFEEGLEKSQREAFLEEWCVDYVYCPHAWAVGEDVLQDIAGLDGVTMVLEEGRGAVFRVLR